MQKVTVVHFWRSHIQTGFWTEVLMTAFKVWEILMEVGTFIFHLKLCEIKYTSFFKSFTTGKWIRKRSALAKEM